MMPFSLALLILVCFCAAALLLMLLPLFLINSYLGLLTVAMLATGSVHL
jgi:hypothetical protein